MAGDWRWTRWVVSLFLEFAWADVRGSEGRAHLTSRRGFGRMDVRCQRFGCGYVRTLFDSV